MEYVVFEVPDEPVEHVVIDVETLSTESNASILSIGATCISKEDKVVGAFYIPVDIQSCMDAGLAVDAATLKWWLSQGDEAREVLGKEQNNAPLLDNALSIFFDWIDGLPGNKDWSVKVWGNGSEFDIVILENAFKVMNYEIPWKFWNIMSMRVITYLNAKYKLGITREEPTVKHNALADAKAEAAFICSVLQRLQSEVSKKSIDNDTEML